MQNLTVVLYHAPCYHVATQLLHQDDVVLSAHQAHHIHHAHNVHHIQVHTDVHMALLLMEGYSATSTT